MAHHIHIGKADSVTFGGQVHDHSIVLNEMNFTHEDLNAAISGTEGQRHSLESDLKGPSSKKKKNNRLVLPGGVVIDNAENVTFGDINVSNSSVAMVDRPPISPQPSKSLPSTTMASETNIDSPDEYLTDSVWIKVMEGMYTSQKKRSERTSESYRSKGLPPPITTETATFKSGNGKKYQRTPSGRWRLVKQ